MTERKVSGDPLTRALDEARQRASSMFPLDAFPPWLREHVESVAHRLQVSVDMPAAFALAVFSAAVGRSLTVRAWRGFEQPAVVWVVIAAASGENKSAVVNAMKRPVVDYQRGRRAREEEPHRESVRAHELLKKQAEALVSRATKGKSDVSMDDAQAAMREADEATPSPLFRLTFDSATTEALVKGLADHEFLAHLEGEGDVFTDIVGRYDSGGLLKQYLDAFDGEGIDLDRVGRGNTSAERVLLVLGVMLQPDMLVGVMSERHLKGRGLLERCLFAMPQSLVGRRDVRALEGNSVAESAYVQRLLVLCERFHGLDAGHQTLALTPEAQDRFVEYRTRVEARLSTDLTAIVSWVSKAQGGIVLRVAALLAVMWDENAKEVGPEIMGHAVSVMERFFIPQALRTHGDLRGDGSGHLLRQLGRWLKSQAGVFTARDLQKARGDLFPTADKAREALDSFVDEGVLEIVERPRTSALGPKPGKGYKIVRQSRQDPPTNTTAQNSETNGRLNRSDDLSGLSDLSAVTMPHGGVA